MDLSFNTAVLAVAGGLLFGLYGSDRTDELFINYKRSFIIKVMVSVDIRVIMSFCTASNALKDKSKVRGDF